VTRDDVKVDVGRQHGTFEFQEHLYGILPAHLWKVGQFLVGKYRPERGELVVGCGDIKGSCVGSTEPADATSRLNVEVFVDDIIQRKIVSAFDKLERSEHIEITTGV